MLRQIKLDRDLEISGRSTNVRNSRSGLHPSSIRPIRKAVLLLKHQDDFRILARLECRRFAEGLEKRRRVLSTSRKFQVELDHCARRNLPSVGDLQLHTELALALCD